MSGLALEKKPRSRQTREAKLAKAFAWRNVKRDVMRRDHYRCRACGSRDQVDCHHIKFRSVGGGDSTRNCCALCRVCHDELHAYRLVIVGENANRRLKFERRRIIVEREG